MKSGEKPWKDSWSCRCEVEVTEDSPQYSEKFLGFGMFSPQNTRSTFAQTKISLMAKIRVSLFSLVFIGTLWLLLWGKRWEEGEREKERTVVVSTRARSVLHTSVSHCV